MRLRAYVNKVYTRSGQVAPDTVMALLNIADADSGDQISSGMSVVLNKHGKDVGVTSGDTIEFEAKVASYNGKTTITNPRNFRVV